MGRRRRCFPVFFFTFALVVFVLLHEPFGTVVLRSPRATKLSSNGIAHSMLTSNVTTAENVALSLPTQCYNLDSVGVGIAIFILNHTAVPLPLQALRAAVTIDTLRAAGSTYTAALVVDHDVDLVPIDIRQRFSCLHRLRLPLSTRKARTTMDLSHLWHVLWHLDDMPFSRTLVINGGSGVCADVTTAWKVLDDVDIAVTHGGNKQNEPSTLWLTPSVLLLKSGPKLAHVAETLRRLLPLGSSRYALISALTYASFVYGARSRLLPPEWFMSFQTAYTNSSIALSLVFDGRILISDMPSESPTLAQIQQRCSWINSASYVRSKRMFMFIASSRSVRVALSQVECSKAGSSTCSGLGLEWDDERGSLAYPTTSTMAAADTFRTMMGNSTYGVTYFGYSTDPSRVARYTAEIEAAAWGLKLHNPWLPVCLFTNAQIDPYPPFDHVVKIADDDVRPPPMLERRGSGWNILTRVRYHVRSPYEFTLQIDSDRIVCSQLTPIYQLLRNGWDFVSTSSGSMPTLDHGVIGMHHSPELHQLIRNWGNRMVERHDEGRDEQRALFDVRASVPGIRVGVMDPVWQIKFMPANHLGGEVCASNKSACPFLHTLVANGKIHIYTTDAEGLDDQHGVCKFINAASDRPRLVTYNTNRGIFDFAFDKRECETKMPGFCKHREIRWEPYPQVTAWDEYVLRYSGIA